MDTFAHVAWSVIISPATGSVVKDNVTLVAVAVALFEIVIWVGLSIVDTNDPEGIPVSYTHLRAHET